MASQQGHTSPEFLAIHLALGDALLPTSLEDAIDTYAEVRLSAIRAVGGVQAVMPFPLLTPSTAPATHGYARLLTVTASSAICPIHKR